jgi:flavin-dependent dehydrogenase
MKPDSHSSPLQLQEGSKIGVIGGGPAGSFFGYFFLDMARRVGIDVQLDIFEPKDFSRPGASGCNHCGGIISESLVQILATEGLDLPPNVVQRGIDSYVMHTDVGNVKIDTPLHEKRIGAVYRGCGPRGKNEVKWDSFDGYLLAKAKSKGANVIEDRVDKVNSQNGKIQFKLASSSDFLEPYDLMVVATGVNSASLKLFEDLNLHYSPPKTSKTFIREYFLGKEVVEQYLGNSMHVFLIDLPRFEFAAIIPKGESVTICVLGNEIDKELIDSFLSKVETKKCFPPDFQLGKGHCQCWPGISISSAQRPFADRIVFIGDTGTTRLYKDGIGAAYITAKAAATTAIFQGVSAQDFKKYYWPVCKRIKLDNFIGMAIFGFTHFVQKLKFTRQGILRMVAAEQQKKGKKRTMSTVLWDMFSGSAPYRDIFIRTLKPSFLTRFLMS